MLFTKEVRVLLNYRQMATYCDEFEFEELFEDPNYVLINQIDKEEEEEDADYEKNDFNQVSDDLEKLLDSLEFINESMTEEQLDKFWKEIPNHKVTAVVDDEDISTNTIDIYFQREIIREIIRI